MLGRLWTSMTITRFKFPIRSRPSPITVTYGSYQIRSMANHRHKKIVKMAKGYRGRTNCYKIALLRVEKALQYAYRDRRVKKRDFRSMWIQRINAAVGQYGISYSRFIPGLQAAGILVNRKILADLAVTEPFSFKGIVDTVKSFRRIPPRGGQLSMEPQSVVSMKVGAQST